MPGVTKERTMRSYEFLDPYVPKDDINDIKEDLVTHAFWLELLIPWKGKAH
jgi:hypothetical protein